MSVAGRALPDTGHGFIVEARGAPTVNLRIGIATGDIIFGNVGSDTMKGFTAIGDQPRPGQTADRVTPPS